jgi:hypothetical protein
MTLQIHRTIECHCDGTNTIVFEDALQELLLANKILGVTLSGSRAVCEYTDGISIVLSFVLQCYLCRLQCCLSIVRDLMQTMINKIITVKLEEIS